MISFNMLTYLTLFTIGIQLLSVDEVLSQSGELNKCHCDEIETLRSLLKELIQLNSDAVQIFENYKRENSNYTDEDDRTNSSNAQLKRFQHCDEAVQTTKKTDIYLIEMWESIDLKIRCKFNEEENNGWLIIQQRLDSSGDFKASSNGMGNPQGNYFLSLELVHRLTKEKYHNLWIEVSDFDGRQGSIIYNNFAIDDGPTYALNIGDVVRSNNLSDSLSMHFGHNFVEESAANTLCTRKHRGWWYTEKINADNTTSETCLDSNLNGIYYDNNNNNSSSKPVKKNDDGIFWKSWTGGRLKTTEMAIRVMSLY